MSNFRRPSSPPRPTATRPRATSAKSAPATSTGSPPPSTRAAKPSPSSAPPSPSSSTKPNSPGRPSSGSSSSRPACRGPAQLQRRTTMNTRIEIAGPMRDRYDEILTDEALTFLAELHARFSGRRHDQLAARMQRRFDLGNGRDLRFLPETSAIRADASWRVAGAGPGLEDRRVEITGPTDPKMAINALNSGTNRSEERRVGK